MNYKKFSDVSKLLGKELSQLVGAYSKFRYINYSAHKTTIKIYSFAILSHNTFESDVAKIAQKLGIEIQVDMDAAASGRDAVLLIFPGLLGNAQYQKLSEHKEIN